MKPYLSVFYTGDGAARDESASTVRIYLLPRFLSVCSSVFRSVCVAVIKVSGHPLSTAEIESALVMHPGVTETAGIGSADELTGQPVYAFLTLKL